MPADVEDLVLEDIADPGPRHHGPRLRHRGPCPRGHARMSRTSRTSSSTSRTSSQTSRTWSSKTSRTSSLTSMTWSSTSRTSSSRTSRTSSSMRGRREPRPRHRRPGPRHRGPRLPTSRTSFSMSEDQVLGVLEDEVLDVRGISLRHRGRRHRCRDVENLVLDIEDHRSRCRGPGPRCPRGRGPPRPRISPRHR